MALAESLLSGDAWSWVIGTLGFVLACSVGESIYNILFHPLAAFPGPLLWRASRIPYTLGGLGGSFPYDVRKLHQQYGDIVRVAPNELSFADPDAWDDIYSNTAGANQGAFAKSKVWHGQSQAGPPSVFAAYNLKEHARIRRFMDPAFSERAVVKQEPIVQEYANLCIDKLRERCSSTGATTVNIIDWFNFVFLDIVGDLSFGESFDCLQKCEYEGWMSQMAGAIKLHYIYINLRHFPISSVVLGPLLWFLMPKSLIEEQEAYRKRSTDKLNRRLATQSTRQDIVSQLLQSEDRKAGLTKDEVLLNSMLFINAASETTTTTLAGAANHLLQNPKSLSKLEGEIRQFSRSSDLTFAVLKQLPYLNAVLKEALRMCNPNPIGHLRITPSSGGIVAGHYIPGNTLVTAHPLTISFSEDNFHDASTWHPERWLNEAEIDPKSVFYHDRRKAVRGFGWGPQNCVGEPLAWAQMRLVLAKMGLAFDLRKAGTAHSKIDWEKQEVYGILFKHRLDVTFVERVA